MVSTAGFHAKSSGLGSRRFERNENVSSPSTPKTQYCGRLRDGEVASSA